MRYLFHEHIVSQIFTWDFWWILFHSDRTTLAESTVEHNFDIVYYVDQIFFIYC